MLILIKCLIAPLVILLCGNLGSSQSMLKENKQTNSLVIDNPVWTESDRNIELQKNGGTGFMYPYNLPDAQHGAIAIFRTYSLPSNSGFSIIELNDSTTKLKALSGQFKFSGSDIDQTKDTLMVVAYYSKTNNSKLFDELNMDKIPEEAHVIKITEPSAQFKSFHIKLTEPINPQDKKYLVIQLILKSGSDDSYYYGESNAVIDNLYFTKV